MSELYVSVSPQIRSPRTTQTIMRDVLIALCPALIASCIIFGARALLVSAVCVAASVLFEFLYQKGTKQPVTISDCSAAVTGLILAMNLPVTIPLWQAVFGCLIALVNKISKGRAIKKKEFGCAGCPMADSCGQLGEKEATK